MGQWMELTAASCCFSILGYCIQWLHAYITNCRADVWWAFFQTIRPSGLCQRSGISIHYLWDVVSRDALDTTLRSLNVYLPGKASDFFFLFFFARQIIFLETIPWRWAFLWGMERNTHNMCTIGELRSQPMQRLAAEMASSGLTQRNPTPM